MTAKRSGKPGRTHRSWRWLRLGCWAVFLLCFTWYAYVRITTPPAAYDDGSLRGQRGIAHLPADLIHEIRNVPLPPSMRASASSRLTFWGGNVFVDAVLDWGPAGAQQRWDASKAITTPAVWDSLDDIVRISEDHAYTPGSEQHQTRVDSDVPPLRYDESAIVIGALTFRARHRVAEQKDVAGALVDLRAALRLADWTFAEAFEIFSHPVSVILPQRELGCLAQEVAVPPNEAREMIRFLREELSLSVADAFRKMLAAYRDVDQLLDRYYTDDGSGDGWLVLNAAYDLRPNPLNTGRTSAHPVWNLFSPLFHDRATMQRRLLGLDEELRRLDEMSHAEAVAHVASWETTARGVSVLDGPLASLTGGIDRHNFGAAFGNVRRRRALVVMLALSAYKSDHGSYPQRLEDLVPTYLENTPLDAETHASFRYERPSATTYDLGPALRPGQEPSYDWWEQQLGYPEGSYLPRRRPGKP